MSNLFWKGRLEELKTSVCDELNLDGKWSSPGGDVKLFVTASYSLKWYGRSRKKLMILSDDDDRTLENKLMEMASKEPDIVPNLYVGSEEESNMAVDRLVQNVCCDGDALSSNSILYDNAYKNLYKTMFTRCRYGAKTA